MPNRSNSEDVHKNDNESISEFVSRLRKCASTCNYETFLERALKEQFTVGLRNKETQLKLLSKEHSLEESIQQAIADEAAFRESAIIVLSSGGTNVNHVKRSRQRRHRLLRINILRTSVQKRNLLRNLFPQVPTLLLVLPPINATPVVSPIINAVLVGFVKLYATSVLRRDTLPKYVSLPKLFIVWKKLTKIFIILLLMLLKDCLLTWMLRGEM